MARYPFGQKAEDVAQNVGPTGSVMATANTFFIFFNARTGGSEVTDLSTDSAGTLPIAEGSYKTDQYGNFGTLFYGPDTVKELWAQAVNSTAPRVLLQCWQSALPVSTFTQSGGTAWAASTAYPVGLVFKKADGSYRAVKTAYTTGASYTGTDDTNSIPLNDPPPVFSSAYQPTTDTLYAPLSSGFGTLAFWDGRLLKAGYDMDPNGIDMPFAGVINQIGPVLDLPTMGSDAVLALAMLNTGSGGNVMSPVGIARIVNGQVAVITAMVRSDTSCTTTSGSSTIGDTHITVDDFGRKVTGTGIPANSYVGAITAGVSFVLSSSPSVSTPVNATATGTVTLTIGATFSFAKKDKLFIRATAVGSTYAGKGLKLRLALGSETFASTTTPGVPSALAVTSQTPTSVSFGWTPGTNSDQTVFARDGIPYDYVGTLAAYTDNGINGAGLASTESHLYSIAARRGPALSAFVGSLTAGPGSTTSVLPHADGAVDPAKFFTSKGSAAPGTNPNIATNRLRITSGSTGSNSVNDRVILRDINDGTTFAGEVQDLLQFNNTTSYFEWYVSTADFDPAVPTSFTTGIQFQASTNNWRIGYHTSGGFFTLASGTWTLTPLTDYGFRCVAATVDPGAGTQQLTFYQGTAAAFNASPTSLPQISTVSLGATPRAAIPAGKMLVQQLGTQVGSTAVTQYTDHGALNFVKGSS